MSQLPGKTYLGDSVYVEIVNGDMLKLTTENGVGPSNTIYLEYAVYQALVGWVEDYSEAAKQVADEEGP